MHDAMKPQNRILYCLFGVLLLSAASVSLSYATTDDLGVLSIDELLDLDVVSVAKIPEKVSQSPAAVYVITQEALRRSGASTIPEALRMVPGMHVYRINGNKWAVSARGFAGRFANKMLVMIDGRAVYTPLFSGVFWDVQDTMIEDIEQIEVIRGPGGTLWGANAVNGIINIITKTSADTQGGLLSMETGSHENGTVAARYGGWLDEYTAYRVYGKFFDRNNFETTTGDNANDDYHIGRTGFRMDRNLATGGKLTLQGDAYEGKANQTRTRMTLSPPYSYKFSDEAQLSGGNLIGRWNHIISSSSDMNLQFYYDHTQRDEKSFKETRDTVDMDFQHRFALTLNQEILWGLGYRYNQDNTSAMIDSTNGLTNYQLNPENRYDDLFSGFIQDRLSFADNKGEITIGTKIEHNDYTGLEWQPSGRLLWNFTEKSTIWAAISRSIKTPSRSETNGSVNAGAFFNPFFPPAGRTTVTRIMANDDVDSEKVMSYEVGYRIRPKGNLFVDVTAFYNHYRDLTGGINGGAPFPEFEGGTPYMVMPVVVDNSSDGETYGFEFNANWSVSDWCRLNASYTWFDFNVLNNDNQIFQRPGFDEKEQAQHQASLSSYMDLPGNIELNAFLAYVDDLPNMDIDNYVYFDLNLTWHATAALTMTIGGRNLFDNDHTEFDSSKDGIVASEIPRSVYGKLVWNF